jgi:hypothetical protein
MVDGLIRFLLGYMEDVIVKAREENPHVSVIIQKHLDALREDLNEHDKFYPIDDK